MHHARIFRLAVILLVPSCAPLAMSLRAQTSVSYANGELKTAPLTTTAANPYTLNVLTGSAQQTGLISGDGTITKLGAGTLTLTGNNDYTGGTIINDGVLFLNSAGAAGTGSITRNNGGGLTLGFDGTFSNAISGGGYVTTYGNITLTGANTHTGYTRLASGSLRLGAGALGDSDLMFNGGTLVFTSATDYSDHLAATTGQQFRFDTDGQTVTFANATIGAGNTLEKFGLGTLILAADVGHSGTTTVWAGTLQVGNGGTTGQLNGDVIVNGAADLVFNRSGTYQQTHAIQNAGDLTVTGGGTLQLTGSVTGSGKIQVDSGSTLQISGTTAIANDLYVEGALVADYGTLTISGAIAAGAGTLTKSGIGTLTLTNTNAVYGGTTVSSGTLQLGDGNTTGILFGTINVASGATLAFNPAGTYTYASTIFGSGSLDKRGAGTLVLTGGQAYHGGTTVSGGTLQINDGGSVLGNIDVSYGATLSFNRSGDVSFGNVISGYGAFMKDGAGKLTFTNTQTYTGPTQVIAGTLQVGNAGWIDSDQISLSAGATFAFSRSDDVAYAGQISGSGTLVKAGSGTLTLTGYNSHPGTTNISAGTLQLGNGGTGGSLGNGNITVASGATLAINRSDDVTYGGALSGGGTLLKTGANTLTLAGAATHTGGTTVSGGTLRIGALVGMDEYYNNVYGGSVTGNITNQAALVFDRGDDVAYAGVISGTGTVTKSGGGALTLTGAHTYTGATTVSAGTLIVNGSLANTAVTVSDFSQLGGAGTFGGLVTLAGGRLSPGNSAGTLTFANGLTLEADTSIDFELGATSDLLRISGGVLTGPASGQVYLNLADSGGFAANTYELFNFSGATLNDFSTDDFVLGSWIEGYDYAFNLTGSSLQLVVTASAIPEPDTYALLAGMFMLVACLIRRRPLAAP